MAELARLEGVFARSKQAAGGVASPVRTTGPVGGVRIVIPRAPSPFGVLDCRLALAVVELSRVAAEHDVVEIRIDNTHRPKAKLPGKRKPSQHAYGLAADITTFRLADGRTLSVERDWHAPIGAQVCGPDAVLDEPTESAIALRNLVCDIARQGVFHRVLTPGFNAAHKDHLHLDIMRDEKRQIVR